MDNTKNLILVEDHVIVRNGLKVLIEKIGPYKIIAEYNHGGELVNDYPFKTNPDMIILDLDMPVMNGEELVTWMQQNGVKVPILLLTLNDNEEQIVRLFHLGVRGYLNKNCSSDMMRTAITEIFETGYYHNEWLTKAMLAPKVSSNTASLPENLTDREIEFLKLVCHEEEYTYDQIAQIMKIGRRSVDHYREALFEKFGIKSKTGLVLFAIKYAIVKI